MRGSTCCQRGAKRNVGGRREEKPVTADTALRLGKFFKTGAAFWMNIQARFDLETAEDVLAPQIKKIAAYEADAV